MNYAKVTAIVRAEKLERIEARVTAEGACGMSVTEVRGCGELKDFFRKDWLVNHARVEIFTSAERAEHLAQAIMEEAATGEAGDGIVAILPVHQVYRVRTRAPLAESDL